MGTVILQNGGDIVEFDVETNIDLDPSWRISNRPIAEGNPVSDHAQRLNTPITFMAVQGKKGRDGDTDRQRRLIEGLERLGGKPLVMIIEGYATYYPVMLERYPHSLTGQSAIMFEVTVRPVKIAKQSFVDLPPERIKKRAKASASKTQKIGKPGKQVIPKGSPKENELKAKLAVLNDTKTGQKVVKALGVDKFTAK
jgi:hypothetical protein